LKAGEERQGITEVKRRVKSRERDLWGRGVKKLGKKRKGEK